MIVSTVADLATDAVVTRLAADGIDFERVNTEDVPFGQVCTLGFEPGKSLAMEIGRRPVAPVDAIWYRRLRSAARPADMDAGVYDFCVRESRSAFLGGLLAQQARWMSHPAAIWQAEFKPYQLQVAQTVGLAIPRTVVTSDPDAIRTAHDAFGSLVAKPVRSGHFKWGGADYSIFTSRVSDSDLETLDQAPWCPSIYQELIPKKFDIRVTIVGRQLFAAAIDSQSDPSASIDWRRTENPLLPHTRIDLPVELQEQLHALMNVLGLAFGCVDMVLTPSEEFVFLEINPSGQWLWLDDALGFDITGAIAAWLGERP
ncbi:MAG: hypothetical protein JSR92_16285 [Proteobacteria bacterium]|nr:hypothetical protein [Pseudomonadota bacterium]